MYTLAVTLKYLERQFHNYDDDDDDNNNNNNNKYNETRIFKTRMDSKCRLCDRFERTIDHVISARSILVQEK